MIIATTVTLIFCMAIAFYVGYLWGKHKGMLEVYQEQLDDEMYNEARSIGR